MEKDLNRIGRTVDLQGMGQATMVQLTGGAFLTGYMLAFGASEFLIGIVAALPLFSKLSQLYTSWRIERKGHWAQTAARGAIVGRLPLLIAAAVPFLGLPNELSALLLVTVIGVSALGGSIFEIGFLTWMAELVPASRRGEFWGKRTRVTEFVGPLVAVIASYFFDRWRRDNPGEFDGFMAIFALGAVTGLAAILFLRRIPVPEVEHHKIQRRPLFDTLTLPMRDWNFRRLLIFAGIWGFAVGMLGPFTMVYMLRELKLTFLASTIFIVTPAAMMAFTQVYWGRLSDHFGCRPVLRSGTFLISFVPLLWLLTTPERIWPIALIQVLSGVGWAAYHISMNTLVLKLAPEKSRSSYVASMGAVFAVAQAVSPLVGGAAISIMKESGLPPMETYYVLFAASFMMRVPTTFLIGQVHEPGGAALSHMIRVLGRFRSMSSSLAPDFIYDYAFTHLARIADFITRENRPRRTLRRRLRRGEGRSN